ncbi:MAG: hypothetical protein ACFCVK_16630 [Acidimicrobiales bacterium]
MELGRGVFAWTHPEPRYGNSNVGLVIDGDGLTVVDTSATPARGAAARSAIIDLTAELDLRIKRVVLSSSRVAFSGGSDAFWPAAYYGSESTSDQLDSPAAPGTLARLLPHLAEAYDEGFTTRPITHTVSEEAALSSAAVAVPLPGEGPVNLAVHVAGAGVVFAGALGSFGVTPLAFDGDPAAWATSLQRLAALAPTIVPGHGPPGGAADVADLVGYLRACVAAGGDPQAIAPGPWDGWTDRRFDAVNVERAARLAADDREVPAAMYRLLGLV